MGTTTKHHPLTGALIAPLGYRKDGRAIWPIMGGDDTVPPADPAPSDPPPADPPADPPASKQPPWGDPENFNAEKAWELIQNLRTKEGRNTELEQRLAEMETAQQSQMDAIAKALGLKSDDTPPDPEALTAQVQAEQAKARESAVQLAVYRNAAANEANPDLLLDSASFLRSVSEVDPTDGAAVSAAIKAAVEANPVFKASTTPPAPSFPGGPRTPAAPQRAGTLGEAISQKFAGNNH